jgi:hypothetical protein
MDKVMPPGCRAVARRRRDGMDLRARGPRELQKRGMRRRVDGGEWSIRGSVWI